MNDVAQDILMHYGTKRHSGRYPWGSGDSPYQHENDFLARYDEYKKQGLSEVEIARAMKCVDGTKELRMYLRIANHERTATMISKAQKLREEGKTYQEISDSLGLSGPSAAQALVLEKNNSKQEAVDATVKRLREEVQKKGAIDIGEGVETDLGISKDTLREAATRLAMEEGYSIHGVGVKQPMDSTKQTTVTALTKDISYGDLYKDPSLIQPIDDSYSDDGGRTWHTTEYPASIDSNRISINYRDDGGKAKDGVIEIRPGCPDLSLGDSHYAQVRILVDGTHYLKGMAMYADDLPDGVDIRFNTNKPEGTPKMDVLKPCKDDPDNPFGAYIKAKGQSHYTGEDGQEHLSAINKIKEEGDWDDQRISLSSQFLGKQPVKLAKQQLDITYDKFADEYERIDKVTNNIVKKKMLADFAGKCDKAAEDLDAAGLPRQRTQVILPLTKIKDNEIYATNFKNGEQVALIRYPHGGTFEIPILTVNNNNAQGKNLLGRPIDAVGISTKVAEKLSGADFDGDFVSVIPLSDKVKIRTSSMSSYKGLEGFDPKDKYPPVKDSKGNIISKTMTKAGTQQQMGIVSNLITDMTIKGAPPEDIAKAVRHSMVVIDAEKHKLNYRQSAIDNEIASLRKKWQVHTDLDGNEVKGGASTLLSRAGAEAHIKERREIKPDPETGERRYVETGRTYFKYEKDKNGDKVKVEKDVLKKTPQMDLVSDANKLSTGTKIENVYAGYANKMKALANTARKAYLSTPNKPEYNKSAAAVYSKEVAHLNTLLKNIDINKPKERQAIIQTNAWKKNVLEQNPELGEKANKAKLNKRTAQVLNEARISTGSKSSKIHLTDREWDAIQAGAVTMTKAKKILDKVDPDELKQRATPRQSKGLTTTQKNRIEHLMASGYTQADIAESMGISSSTVSRYLRGESD